MSEVRDVCPGLIVIVPLVYIAHAPVPRHVAVDSKLIATWSAAFLAAELYDGIGSRYAVVKVLGGYDACSRRRTGNGSLDIEIFHQCLDNRSSKTLDNYFFLSHHHHCRRNHHR